MLIVQFNKLLNSPIIDGVIVKDVSFVGNLDTIVNHKLGREPLGFIVIGQKQGDVVYESTTTNNNRDKFLILKKDTANTPYNNFLGVLGEYNGKLRNIFKFNFT